MNGGDNHNHNHNHDAWLTLSLSYHPILLPPPKTEFASQQQQQQQQQDDHDHDHDQDQDQETTLSRARFRPKKEGKSETISPPYPWATSTRATVHTLHHLLSQNMMSITGAVQCKRCNENYDIAFDLNEKFNEVALFVARNRYDMHDRAPTVWTNPLLPTCNHCGQQNSMKPVITKKRTTNWLFLLLGQMIGCCNLSHLKYFCKHTKNHRTAAKNRLIYLTYLGLCKQLNPDGPFDP